MTDATEFAPGLMIQALPPPKLADYKLIAFDMDSTLITIECIDEIADATGKKAEVAAITEATMRGEITDFKDSLRQRVGKLVGVTEADMARVLAERLQLSPGAHPGQGRQGRRPEGAAGLRRLHLLCRACARPAAYRLCARQCAGDQGRRLTGGLVEQAWGDICDGAEKRRTLLEVAS
jgi:phosphoserine phosphatase